MHIASLIQGIQEIPPALLIFPGALYLFFGWQLYRVTLSVAAAVFGAFVGAAIAHVVELPPSIEPLLVVAGVLLFATLAVFLKRMALFILGGLAGVALVMLAAAMFETEVAYVFWQIMMFLAGGSCAVKFLRPLVIFSTSLLGGLTVWRSVDILLLHESRRLDALGEIVRKPAGFALLVVLVAFGIFYQATSDGALRATPIPPIIPPPFDRAQGGPERVEWPPPIPPIIPPPTETPPSQTRPAPPPPAEGQSR